jgi:hypothetical protein
MAPAAPAAPATPATPAAPATPATPAAPSPPVPIRGPVDTDEEHVARGDVPPTAAARSNAPSSGNSDCSSRDRFTPRRTRPPPGVGTEAKPSAPSLMASPPAGKSTPRAVGTTLVNTTPRPARAMAVANIRRHDASASARVRGTGHATSPTGPASAPTAFAALECGGEGALAAAGAGASPSNACAAADSSCTGSGMAGARKGPGRWLSVQPTTITTPVGARNWHWG